MLRKCLRDISNCTENLTRPIFVDVLLIIVTTMTDLVTFFRKVKTQKEEWFIFVDDVSKT